MNLEQAYDLKHQLRHLEERWNNRFTLERSLAEQYLKGNFSVVLELKSCRHPHEDSIIAIYEKMRIFAGFNELTSIAPEYLQVSNTSEVIDRSEQLVFVSNIEVMNGAKHVVPTFVRLQGAKQIDDLWSGPVYCSTNNHFLKVFGTFAEWELNARNAAIVMAHHIAGEQIERGPQVVNGIPNHERPFIWRGVSLDNPKQFIAGLRLNIQGSNIRVFPPISQDVSIQGSDVFVGPLNF